MVWTVVDAAKIHFLDLAKIWLTKGRHCDRGRAYRGHFSVPEGGTIQRRSRGWRRRLCWQARLRCCCVSRQAQYVVNDLEETYQLQ